MRHLFGSHEADWAIHKDGWYREKYEHVLSKLGFDEIHFEFSHWQMTYNIIVKAKKHKMVALAKLRQISKDILRECVVDESPTEEVLWALWCQNFDRSLSCNYTVSPTVSIFMPVYNSEKYLAETLESLLLQTYCGFEIIIADDGSTDKSLQIARDYENRDKRIKVFSLPHNGEVKTRNEAIKHTNPNSKYLLNHDSDDISLPNKLEKLVGYLEEHPEIAIVGCIAEYFDDEHNYRGKPPIEWQPERIRETFGEVNSMINSASLIRREVFDKIGYYREEYRSVDDYDFFARALIAGFELANIPEVLHRIRLHPASVGSTRAKTQQILAEKIRENYKQQNFKEHDTGQLDKPGCDNLNGKTKFQQLNKSLSVLHTVEFYSPHTGGAEIVVQQISERLAKRGHLVTVATTKLDNRMFHELNGVQIEEFSVKGSLGNGIHGHDIEHYKDFVRHHPADVMMNYAAQQWATDLAFEALPMRENKVNVIAPCGYSALSNSRTICWPQFADYFNRIIPTIVPQYDTAIYHSALYQDYEYAKNHGFTNSMVIPNGVDEEEFLRLPQTNFREKYNIRTPFWGLCVANFYEGKGQERVIECVKQMNRPDFTMVFIGKEGAQLSNLKAQAAGMNVQFFMDIPREDTLAAYYEADIFLFGSHIEASPLVIIEAKASKTPFVSTDCGNVREWKGGIVCAPEDMAIHANNILDNESLRIQLVNEGYREWKEKLTWESIVDKYEELYLRLLREKRIFSSKITYTQDTKSFSKSNQFQDNNNESIIADLSSDLFNKAEVFFQNGAYNEAINNYKKAIESNPSFYDAYDGLAIAYAKVNQTDNAILYLEKAIRLRSGDASVYNNLGVLYFKKGMYLDAKTYFEIALLINVNYREAQQNLEKVNDILNETSPTEKTNQIIGLIFSKDRAMQLDGTLRSFYMHCKDTQLTDLTVIYKTSNALHDKLYDALKKEYSNVTFIKEKDFKEQVLPLIRKYTYVLFLVDDNIFVRDFYITNITRSIDMNKNAIGFSLRLGENTVYCYALNAAQKLPMFSSVEKDILKYNWVCADLDFGYPLEVSSSVYRVKEIYPLLAQIQFSNPNTLEGQMAANKQIYVNTRPILLCGKFSFTFCAPLNIVQNVCDNRVGSETCYSSETLANKFEEGYRIDVEKYINFTPHACHQEVSLELRKSNL
ncbi:MAG TPA: glycosyltransferase [Candidatus Wunengus sp. YC64]